MILDWLCGIKLVGLASRGQRDVTERQLREKQYFACQGFADCAAPEGPQYLITTHSGADSPMNLTLG